MDKRRRASLFRERLIEVMSVKGMTKSGLSRAANVDRSTIGQLLKNDQPRLPNAQLAADAANALGVSTDWLLGLTNRPETPGDIIAAALSLSPAERTSADEQLLEWHHEAAGYKVRHVPATLPDILKTKRILDWEYASVRERRLPEAHSAIQDQLQWLSSGVSDYEIAVPVHEIESCAAGTAYYKNVEKDVRYEQLGFIADQCDQMFPRLRIFLFDAHNVGQCYLAFREVERIKSLSSHFDWLVREAVVDARNVSTHIRSLIKL